MPRTLSVSDPLPGQPPDLDGRIVDGFESLRQRCIQALYFRLRQWFLATNRGIPREEIEGHQTSAAIARARLTQALRDEGGPEILSLTDVQGEILPQRRFRYSVRIATTYGRDMDLREEISL